MNTTQTTKTVGRPRANYKITIPKTRFTLKQLGVFNKKVPKHILIKRIAEMVDKEIKVIGKLIPKKKQKGRHAFIFEKIAA